MKARVNRLTGGLGLFIGALLAPPVFSVLFSMAHLSPGNRIGLLAFCLIVLATSGAVLALRHRVRSEWSLLLAAALCLIGIELAARLTIVVFRPDMKPGLAGLAARTYPEFMAYRGHPFVQFTGNPSVALRGNEQLGGLMPFNNYGFLGRDFRAEKPDGTVRIAAMGGSTTASGYPAILERYLNEQREDRSITFEALNLGQGWYTTAHSLVNFVLNVVDFSPDYVIIHHAWNDRMARDAGDDFRSDYSHALKAFDPPPIIDKYPIRFSVLYRYVKSKFTDEPPWAFLGPAVQRERDFVSPPYQDLGELRMFERNIRTIIDLAKLNGIRAVLTTQPHSTDPDILYGQTAPHISQCNDVLREVATSYGDEILFVDLDRMMTGRMDELFRDVGHLHETGRRFKAEEIGKVILADRLRNAD